MLTHILRIVTSSRIPSLLVSGLCAASLGHATTLLRVDLVSLSQQARTVVRGRVTSPRAELDPHTGVIVTTWTLLPDEVIAGDHNKQLLEVVTLGGKLGEIAQVVSGSATLSEGEEVALFLGRRPDGRGRVTAMAQGVFRVHQTDTEIRVERAGGTSVWDPASQSFTELEPLSFSLEEFRSRVLEARRSR